jgi:S-adenosylmethionine:tRNA ribosyltransferase-isomerase
MTEPNRFPLGLSISDFGYDLPDDKIPQYPLAQRDLSKLLIWKAGKIEETLYASLADFLPADSLLVFNNSRVIEARIIFQKSSGGQIEIFCLEPHPCYNSIASAMAEYGKVRWICLIGGASKWKRGQILEKKIGSIRLEAHFIGKRNDDFIVEFSWTPASVTFASLLHQLGSIPIPPYLKRQAEVADAERYQTIYAREPGSVAAPTAGLHFTQPLLEGLTSKGIQSLYLTLHVGAGTFMPVKSKTLSDHHMHEEFIEVDSGAIEHLLSKMASPIIAVGTTSLRTLESLYWFGLQVSKNKHIQGDALHLDQWFSYREAPQLTAKDSLTCLLEWLQAQPGKKLIARTQLFIVPGYSFKIVRGLITNFHQPYSTLLLLVAALVGPSWKSIYAWALENNYRFLSYGDGSLFLP